MVRARSSDSVVGGCEFESRPCNLTGHIYWINSGRLKTIDNILSH